MSLLEDFSLCCTCSILTVDASEGCLGSGLAVYTREIYGSKILCVF